MSAPSVGWPCLILPEGVLSMKTWISLAICTVSSCSILAAMSGCGAAGAAGGGGGGQAIIDEIIDGSMDNDNGGGGGDGGDADAGGGESLALEVVVENTGGATGIALRPSDGALFAVNSDGLFGPLETGADLSTMQPIGATNLADESLFDIEKDSLVLTIAESGEFWIGSKCCVTLAVVAAEGGDAAPFEDLLLGSEPSNIKAETLVIIPEGFDGAQMSPGNLLVGQETSNSRLTAVDVANDRAVTNVDNPAIAEDSENGLIRNAHHLAFGGDGTLYSSRRAASGSIAGLQTIAPDGTPADLADTESLSADTFVVLSNDDLILRGIFDPSGGTRLAGLLIRSADDGEIELGLGIPDADRSADDEMVIASDDTIYLAQPNLDQIVRVIDNR